MIKADILLDNKTVTESRGHFNKEYSISTDSRKASPCDIFVALDGPKFKGANFIEECAAKGVSAFVLNDNTDSRSLAAGLKNIAVVFATDTLLYLQEIARIHLARWKEESGGQVIAITGSNGRLLAKRCFFT